MFFSNGLYYQFWFSILLLTLLSLSLFNPILVDPLTLVALFFSPLPSKILPPAIPNPLTSLVIQMVAHNLKA